MIYLDTHVIAWLYADGPAGFPDALVRLLEETDDIRISPMVRLELQHLYEIDRVSRPALPVIDEVGAALGLVVCQAPFAAVVGEAEGHAWTRDPFDRLIVAQAAAHDAPLVTKDDVIHRHYARAVWSQMP